MNFLITGYGRSGTKFLATQMNLSTQWTVNHEPRGLKGEQDEIQKNYEQYFHNVLYPIFNGSSYYGEVNGRLRGYIDYFMKYLPQNKIAILLRNPFDLFTSIMNRRGNINKYNFFVDDIFNTYNNFFEYIENEKIPFISFEKMVTDHNYLQEVFLYFDITDVDVSKIDLIKKINVNSIVKYPKYNDLPQMIIRISENKLSIIDKKIKLLYEKENFFT